MATAAQGAALTVGGGSTALAVSYASAIATKGPSLEDEEASEVKEMTPEMYKIISEPRNGIVTWRSSDKFTASQNSNYNDKLISVFAEHNRILLVKADDLKNQEWWDWAFKSKYLPQQNVQKDPIFTDVVPFPEKEKEKFLSANVVPTPTKKTLNQACDEAYKSDKSNFEQNAGLLKNISMFCAKGFYSEDFSEPISVTYKNDVGEIANYTNGILKVDGNRPFLVKAVTTSPTKQNEKWWDWAFKNKFNSAEKAKYSSLFQNVQKAYLETEADNAGSKTALNQACDEAYKKPHTEFTEESKLLYSISTLCAVSKKVVKLVKPT